ncbi:MAG: pyridoxal phosphate-dependent aminotransferase [Chthoniobacterales bacterium]|nr:pyridoxal phosphate-dependent aminotransferase [Chthoniobacterales bacterium]
MRAPYMEWAKTRSQARFNLATSGIMSVPSSEFPLPGSRLAITGPGGYGYAPLQERIAAHNRVPVECVVAAAGTSMANHLAIAAVVRPGDEVLVEEPAYGPLLDVPRYLDAKVTRFARRFENGFAVDVAALERAITSTTRLIILTNLLNPSGALITAGTLQQIGALAQSRGVRVLVDEAYLEMMFTADAPFAFGIGQGLSGGGENPFIVTNSLTKVYGLSGLRCGWILAAPELARRIWLLNDLFGANAAHPAEQLSVAAFDHLPQFRDRTRTLLATNAGLLDAFLASRRDLEFFKPPAGTVVFPRLTNGDPDEFFALLRDKYEATVVPGRYFEMPQHFRLGIGGDTAELREGLERLGAALDEFAAR